MQIMGEDQAVQTRQPTVSRNTSLGREYYRSALWQDGEVLVKVEAIAFVTGIRARKEADGSITLAEQFKHFDVLNKGEYLQPVEIALFIWDRRKTGPDGEEVWEQEIDHSTEVGLFYQATIEEAEEQCRIFIENLDFAENFDPDAWL